MALTFFSPADKPDNEPDRQAAVDRFRAVHPFLRGELDELIQAAAARLHVPIATISIIDRETQWLAARQGMEDAVVTRAASFCAHTILSPGEPLVAPDAAADRRFAGNPLVTGTPGIRYYAGMPLVDSNGYALGALCAIDVTADRPAVDLTDLGEFARQAERIIGRVR